MKDNLHRTFVLVASIGVLASGTFGASVASAKPNRLSDKQLNQSAAGSVDVNSVIALVGERFGDLFVPLTVPPPGAVAGFVRQITEAAASNGGQGVFQSQAATALTSSSTGNSVATVTQSQTISR